VSKPIVVVAAAVAVAVTDVAPPVLSMYVTRLVVVAASNCPFCVEAALSMPTRNEAIHSLIGRLVAAVDVDSTVAYYTLMHWSFDLEEWTDVVSMYQSVVESDSMHGQQQIVEVIGRGWVEKWMVGVVEIVVVVSNWSYFVTLRLCPSCFHHLYWD